MRSRKWMVPVLASMVFMTIGVTNSRALAHAPTRVDLNHSNVPTILDLLLPSNRATADQSMEPRTKQHRLVERSFHPLLNDSGNVGPPAIQVTENHRVFAYIGTYHNSVWCPSTFDSDPQNHTDPEETSGVKIVELTDPDNPKLIGVIPTTLNAAPKDVRTITLTIDGERRDLLVVSRDGCVATSATAQVVGPMVTTLPLPGTGFEIHDVTDPESPSKIGDWESGGIGVHNLSVFVRPDLPDTDGRVEEGRVFVAAAVTDGDGDPSNAVRIFVLGEPISFLDGFLSIVEITDPAAPTPISTWRRQDADAPCIPRGRRIGDGNEHCQLHDVQLSDDGRRAYLAHWDAGVMILDIANLEKPSLIGHWFPPPDRCSARPCPSQEGDITHDGVSVDDDGNTHTVVPVRDGGRELILVTDEEMAAPINGFLRVVDVTEDPQDPLDPVEWRQVGRYMPPNVARDAPRCCAHAHQAWPGPTMPGGGDIYLAARDDGVRVLRLTEQGREVREVAWFVAGPEDHPDDLDQDPHMLAPDNFGFEAAWPVLHPALPDRLLVLGVDFHRGLYVLEPS